MNKGGIGLDGKAAVPMVSSSGNPKGPSQVRELIPAIDGFRGLAVLTIVVTHVHVMTGLPFIGNDTLTKLIAGAVVDFFFVISGFVLFLPAVRAEGSLGSIRSYAIRRAARIIPLYYVSLLIFILAQNWLIVPRGAIDLPFESGAGTLSLIMHLAFAQNFVLLLPQTIGFGNGVVWTLPLEMVFYILLPLVALRFYRHPFVMLAIALAVGGLWKLAVAQLPQWQGRLGLQDMDDEKLGMLGIALNHAPAYFGQFALGMTGAWIFVKYRERSSGWVRKAAPAVQLVALVFVLRDLLALGADRLAGYPDQLAARTEGLGFWFTLLMLATLVAPSWAQWPAANRAIRSVGIYSYGVYLFHLLFIRLALVTFDFPADGTPGAFFRMLAFVVAGSAAAGWLSYVLVEQPCRRWASRVTRSRAGTRRSAPAGQPPAPAPAESYERVPV